MNRSGIRARGAASRTMFLPRRNPKGRWLIAALIAGALLCAGGLGLLSTATDRPVAADRTDSEAWQLVLVNATHPLPEDHLVETVELDGGESVDVRIEEPLSELFRAAEQAGYHPFVRSGYRTRAEQERVLAERIAYYEDQGLGEQAAQQEASRWVAQPGTSEHELGLAIDINDEDGDEGLYAWLDVHAHEYGFIKRYPEDASQITGISHEPWHYRYVGTEAARDIYLGDLTLEEYLGAA